MRLLNLRSKLIIYNILFYLLFMLVLLFIILQAVWFYSVNSMKEELLQYGTNLNLYIQEVTSQFETNEEKINYYENNSSEFYDESVSQSTGEVELFDNEGLLLSYNSNRNEPAYMNDELEESILTGKPVLTIRTNNGIREIWLIDPLVTPNNTVIGYIGMIQNLSQADNLQSIIFEVIGTLSVIGIIIITLFSYAMGQGFTKPIKQLTEISSHINEGEYDRVIQYKRNDEIGELTSIYNKMTQNINKVIIQLRSERKRLANILASLEDGVIAVSEDGEILLTNKLIKTYFDIVDPKTIYDFNYHKSIIELFNNLKKGKRNQFEEVEVNGRDLLITGSPIKSDVAEENYLIIIRNVTSSKNLEREQRKFISSVSHELRTPLTTIIGYTDMLSRRKVDNPELLEKSLNTINREGHRLVRLVDDLVTANTVETMVFTVTKTKIDLAELLNNVVEQMKIKSWSKEIEIAYKAQENLPEIAGDYDRLSQVFINIIHNAIKFSNVGGKIDVVLTREDERYLNISIRDYGIGIDPAKKDMIFSAFYRVDEDRARNEGEGGAGLGLYLVKQVVDNVMEESVLNLKLMKEPILQFFYRLKMKALLKWR